MKNSNCQRTNKRMVSFVLGLLLVLGAFIAVGSAEVNAETRSFKAEAESIEYQTDLTILDETCGAFKGKVFVFDPKKAGLPLENDRLTVKTADEEYDFSYDRSQKKFIYTKYEYDDDNNETRVDYTINPSKVKFVLNDKKTSWDPGQYSGSVSLKQANGNTVKTDFDVYIESNDNLFSYKVTPKKIVFGKKAGKQGNSEAYIQFTKKSKYEEVATDVEKYDANVKNKKVATVSSDGVVSPVAAGKTTVIIKTKDGFVKKIPVEVTKQFFKEYIKNHSSFYFLEGEKTIEIYSLPGTKVTAKIGGKPYRCTLNKYGEGKIKLKKKYKFGAKAQVTFKKSSFYHKIKTKAKTTVFVLFVEKHGKSAFVHVDNAKKGYVIKIKVGKKTYSTKATINDTGSGLFRYEIKTGKLKKNQKVTVSVSNRKGKLMFKEKMRVE